MQSKSAPHPWSIYVWLDWHICISPLTAFCCQNRWSLYNAHTFKWLKKKKQTGKTGPSLTQRWSSRWNMARAALKWPRNKACVCLTLNNVGISIPHKLQETYKVYKITPANPYSVPSNVSLMVSAGAELMCRNNLCNIPKAMPSGLAGLQRAYTKMRGFAAG